MDYRQAIAEQLEKHIPAQDIFESIETPPDAKMGHFAYPCFKLAKTMRKAPPAIAADIVTALNENGLPPWLESVQSTNAYINFFLERETFAAQVLEDTVKDRYGSSTRGAGKTVVIDFSSPNIAKHFHIGHLGTTIIGRALYNIFSYEGYEVTGINYLGDWGTAFGKLLTAFLRWGDRDEVERTGLDGLTALYVRFHDEAEKDPSLEDEARGYVVKMEAGDEESIKIWKWICEISMREYQKIYTRMGVTFDSYKGESSYNGKMGPAVDELREKGLLVESEGAHMVDLEEYNMPPCLILRRDGGTLYATRDITAAKDRYETYKFDKSLYVVATEQNLYFSQLFKVIELMGYPWAKGMKHVAPGMYSLESGRMQTRKGEVVKLADLLEEAVAKTLAIIEEKSPNLENKAEVAEQVGIGAVVFNGMYNSMGKDVVFSFDRMLNFEGETAPYVQYTHARACSVLQKAEANRSLTPTGCAKALCDDEAFETLRLLYGFPERVAEAADRYEPYIISRFLVALAQAFNKFYNTHIILSGDDTQAGRLALVDAVRNTLENGLRLLGIKAPKKM